MFAAQNRILSYLAFPKCFNTQSSGSPCAGCAHRIGCYLTLIFNKLFRLVLCWVCRQMLSSRMAPPAETPSNSTHIGCNMLFNRRDMREIISDFSRFPCVHFNHFMIWNCSRIYGPRLYPYLTTNWKFVWPNPGKRWVFHNSCWWVGQNCDCKWNLFCAGKVPRMRGAADGPGSQSYAGNINPFSYSARLEAIFLPPVKRFNHDISHDTSFSLILISFKLFTLSKHSSYRRVWHL